MDIDYDRIKKYLELFKASTTPTVNTLKIFESLGYTEKSNEQIQTVMFYLLLLNDQGLIECMSSNTNDKSNLGFTLQGNQTIDIKVVNIRLTILGHQSLEAMTNSKIWDKIQSSIKKIGIESLKQIPSLAVQLLTAK